MTAPEIAAIIDAALAGVNLSKVGPVSFEDELGNPQLRHLGFTTYQAVLGQMLHAALCPDHEHRITISEKGEKKS